MSADSIPSPSVIRVTWPYEVALTESLSQGDFEAALQRWLGSSAAKGAKTWMPPGTLGDAESVLGPALAARIAEEDAQALAELRSVYLHASCRLARDSQSFGADLPVAYVHGQAACEALGDSDSAALAAGHAKSFAAPREVAGSKVQAVPGSTDPSANSARSEGEKAEASSSLVGGLLRPQIEVVEVHGERLEYPLLQPSALEQAIARLSQHAATLAAPPTAAGQASVAGAALANRLGTSRWVGGEDPSPEPLVSAAALLEAHPVGPGRLAPVESAVESSIQGWKAGLRLFAQAEPSVNLDGGAMALLERWYRRALYRDLGLLALKEGDAEFALVALEEAAEARGRVRPSAGMDPLLLAGLAHARYKANELQRSVALLEDMSSVPGWEVAGFAARTVARVAVLGSTADAKVNR